MLGMLPSMVTAYKSFREIRAADLRLSAHCENPKCTRPIRFTVLDLDALIAERRDRPPSSYRFPCSSCGHPAALRVAPIHTGGFRG